MLNRNGNSVVLTRILQAEMGGSDNCLSTSYSTKENTKTLPSEKYKNLF